MRTRARFLTFALSSVAIPVTLLGAITPFEVGLYAGAHTGSSQTKWHAAGFGLAQYNVNSYLSGDIQFGVMNAPSKMISVPQNFAVQSIEFIPRLYIAPSSDQTLDKQWAPGICRPYIEGGVAYFSLTNPKIHNVTIIPNDGFSQTDYNLDSSDIGIIFGGGLDYTITPSLTAGLDVAYVRLRPNFEAKSYSDTPGPLLSSDVITSSDVTTKINLDSVRILLGFRYRFLQ